MPRTSCQFCGRSEIEPGVWTWTEPEVMADWLGFCPTCDRMNGEMQALIEERRQGRE